MNGELLITCNLCQQPLTHNVENLNTFEFLINFQGPSFAVGPRHGCPLARLNEMIFNINNRQE